MTAISKGDRMATTTKRTEVTAEHARIHMKHLLDDTQHHDGRILLTRHGEPAGMLVPPYAGAMPSPDLWQAAQDAYDGVLAGSKHPLRAAEALGALLADYNGYGELGPITNDEEHRDA